MGDSPILGFAWQRDVLRGRPYRNTHPHFLQKNLPYPRRVQIQARRYKVGCGESSQSLLLPKGKEKHREGGRGPPPASAEVPPPFFRRHSPFVRRRENMSRSARSLFLLWIVVALVLLPGEAECRRGGGGRGGGGRGGEGSEGKLDPRRNATSAAKAAAAAAEAENGGKRNKRRTDSKEIQ